MKPSTTRPVSSPSRADKYPPPLMRFLRSSLGSKSRGRSRASPLFMRRKRTTAIEAQQEPSSPKVTCIGQVRVRRSSSGSSKSKPAGPKKGTQHRRLNSSNTVAGNRFCYWVGKSPALCDSFHVSLCRRRRRHGCFLPRWRKWVSFFHCRSVQVRIDSSKKGSNPTGSGRIDSDSDEVGRKRDESREEEEEEEEEEKQDQEFGARESLCRVFGWDASTIPPKNALLLTRCRSAPHRSSYLASRFWGSPLRTEEEDKEKAGEARETEEQENRESTAEEEAGELASLEIEQTRRDSAAESRTDREAEGNLEICKEEVVGEAEDVGSNKAETTTTNPTLKAVEGEKQRERGRNEEGPVVLTRCKSEPTRISGDPLTSSFWRERRLESTVSCIHFVENN